MKYAFAAASGIIGALSIFPGAHAAAQDLAGSIVRCGDIGEEQARLRCFDALVPDARKSDAERRAEASAKAEAEFGLSAVQRNDAIERAHPDKEERKQVVREENLRVEASIAELDISQYGTIFVLDNGQIWKTTSFGGMSTVPRVGQKVTVESGPLGGYRLRLEGKTREVGVKRVQ